ncbi:hypothetical protein TIFTF001_031749 [Ficus carica]|uniref:Uncharacterized protein n=1 Tax=Ficus carica TaxID=3494 RepID=A0AA88DV90_FICCA|nr:hypothetical protein TIFTF001_031749 [Ficus carica]
MSGPGMAQEHLISVKADVYSHRTVLLEICFAARDLKKLVTGEEAVQKTLESRFSLGGVMVHNSRRTRPSSFDENCCVDVRRD